MSVAGLFAAAWLTACGDPLLTAQDRGDPVFEVDALVQNADGTPLASNYQIAVLYLTIQYDFEVPSSRWIEAEVRVAATADVQAGALRVGLTGAPAVFPWTSGLVFHSNVGDAGITTGAFSHLHPPDGVRIGALVIGPADELAAVPTRLDVLDPLDTFEASLAPYLPDTTITGFRVVYAQGVESGDLMNPAFSPSYDEIADGVAISDGFTFVDARAYFEATTWQVCAYDQVDPVYDPGRFEACITANQGFIDCLEQCSIATCQQACAAAFPGQLDIDACLANTALPELIAACGAPLSPRPYQMEVLSPGAALSVTLGVDDVRRGLWIIQ